MMTAILVCVFSACSSLWAATPPPFEWITQGLEEPFALKGQLSLESARGGRGSVELALHDAGGRRHLLLQLSRDRARLMRVEGKNAQVIGEGKMPKIGPRAGFQLFRDSWRLVLCIEGRRALQVYESSCRGGRVGARQNGEGLGLETLSLQPLGTVYFTDDFTRLAGQRGEWEVLSGAFNLHRTEAHKYNRNIYSANAFRGESQGVGLDLAAAGHWFWRNYHFAASVRPSGQGQVGLCVWLQDADNYLVFQCECGPYPRAAQLVRVRGGKSEVLAECARGLESGQWYRLDVRAVEGLIEVGIDGQPVMSAEVKDWQSGRIGLLARDAVSQFDDILAVSTDGIHFEGAELGQPATMPQLPRARLATFGSSSWKDGRCWVIPNERRSSPFFILYGFEATDRFGALKIQYSGRQMALELFRQKGEQSTLLGQASLNGGENRVGLVIEGQKVQVVVDAQEVLSAIEINSTSGPMGLAWKQGSQRPFRHADARLPVDLYPRPGLNPQFAQEDTMQEWASLGLPASSIGLNGGNDRTQNFIDDTFSAAPVLWWAERGQWDIIPRWPCDDRWSWLGGIESESPTLWNKYRLEGDLTVDAWLAPYMDFVEDPVIGYRHPGDLNVTICGDGRNLSSGYSFLFAAKGNTVTQIIRKDQVVAETARVQIVDPRRTNLAFQRHWYHLRMEKKGGHLKYFVDGAPVLEFNDPDPIAGGQAALWTWKGGLMVARVRITAQRMFPADRSPLPALAAGDAAGAGWDLQESPASIGCSFEAGTAGWKPAGNEPCTEAGLTLEGGRRFLSVRNRVSGGAMGMGSPLGEFDASQFPSFSFDFRVENHVKVNLYFIVNGTRAVIPLTSGDCIEKGLVVLPPIAVAPDRQWHEVRYDLLAALRARFPSTGLLQIREIEFSSPFTEYLRSGFGGNPYGCRYDLDNFRLYLGEGMTLEKAKSILTSLPK